ncbi:hypothetical protein D3C80_2211960 [compost metagenome]
MNRHAHPLRIQRESLGTLLGDSAEEGVLFANVLYQSGEVITHRIMLLGDHTIQAPDTETNQH